MGLVAESPKEKHTWLLVLGLAVLIGLALRLWLASFARMPGHGDSAFYYTVARNIADGRGPVVDYIVFFFSGLLPLPHYAGEYWNPTASFLIAIPLLLFGRSISAALVAPILAGLGPAAAGFLAGRRYTGSTALGVMTAILTFFSAFQVWFSVTTEAIIFAGAFGALGIYFAIRGHENVRYLLLAAVFTGLANLIRQDNILLLVMLEACILLARVPWKTKASAAVGAAVIHLAMLTPLLIMNYSHMHVLFPPGPARTAFATTYESIFAYNSDMSWSSMRAEWGITGILRRRLHTASENLGQVEYFLTPLLVLLALAALADALFVHRDRGRLWMLFPPALFALLEYGFYTVVAAIHGPGSLIKSLGALMPFIAMLILGMCANFARSKAALVAVVCIVSAFSAYQGFERNLNSTLYYNSVYDDYRNVKSIVLQDAAAHGLAGQDVTILARDVWDVYEGTGLKTVMVPDNDIDTIVLVARHYGARYLLLPAERPQLDKVYKGLTPDPRMRFVAAVPGTGLKLYRFEFGP